MYIAFVNGMLVSVQLHDYYCFIGYILYFLTL